MDYNGGHWRAEILPVAKYHGSSSESSHQRGNKCEFHHQRYLFRHATELGDMNTLLGHR